MKRKLVTLVFSLLCLLSFGQTPFYTEDFSDAAKVDTTWNLYGIYGGRKNIIFAIFVFLIFK